MSFQTRRELLARVAAPYREANFPQKGAILDEFVASAGYSRKYAIKLLTQPIRPIVPVRRPRPRASVAEVQQALVIAGAAANDRGR